MCKVALVNFNTSQTQDLARATSFARAKLYVSARKFQFLTNTESARALRGVRVLRAAP